MADSNWPEEPQTNHQHPQKRSAPRRIADDIAAGAAAAGSNQMPEIQAAQQIGSERSVEPDLLGRVPGWVWLAITAVIVVFFAFFVTPQP